MNMEPILQTIFEQNEAYEDKFWKKAYEEDWDLIQQCKAEAEAELEANPDMYGPTDLDGDIPF